MTVSMHVVKMVSASSRDVSGSVWRPCMLAVLSQTALCGLSPYATYVFISDKLILTSDWKLLKVDCFKNIANMLMLQKAFAPSPSVCTLFVCDHAPHSYMMFM